MDEFGQWKIRGRMRQLCTRSDIFRAMALKALSLHSTHSNGGGVLYDMNKVDGVAMYILRGFGFICAYIFLSNAILTTEPQRTLALSFD